MARFVGHETLQRAEQETAQPPATGLRGEQGAIGHERGEEALREIFRIVRGAPAAAQRGVNGKPVVPAQIIERARRFRLRPVQPSDERPASGGESRGACVFGTLR